MTTFRYYHGAAAAQPVVSHDVLVGAGAVESLVGAGVGVSLGVSVDVSLGTSEGVSLGTSEGVSLGASVGASLGAAVVAGSW